MEQKFKLCHSKLELFQEFQFILYIRLYLHVVFFSNKDIISLKQQIDRSCLFCLVPKKAVILRHDLKLQPVCTLTRESHEFKE